MEDKITRAYLNLIRKKISQSFLKNMSTKNYNTCPYMVEKNKREYKNKQY